MLLVAITAVFFGFIPAIAVGFVLSGLLFFISMNRSLVRSVVDGTARPSRRVWGGEDAQCVNAARKRIRVIELEGALFFGSAERLSEQVERLGGSVDAVVLDFRRVTAIDATGALLVERLVRRLAVWESRVVLAGGDARRAPWRGIRGPRGLSRVRVEAMVWRRRSGGRMGGVRRAAIGRPDTAR